jgi:transcriptional regulator with XRE-family HTH domain
MKPGRKPTSREDIARGRRLARAIKAARERRQLTQQELANRAGVSYATVRKIEGVEIHHPGFFTIANIARVLELPLEDLAARRTGHR